MEVEEVVKKHALKNALEYGKANVKAVVGKVVAEMPELKNKMKETMRIIAKVVEEVNKMKKEEIEKEIKKYKFKKIEKKRERFIIPNPTEIVITRFPPEPSGYLHIGHAKAVWINQTVAQQYNGYMILRFDDTNPKKERQEYVESIKEDLRWMGIRWKKETYTSDYLELLYEKAEKLIKMGLIYITTEGKESIKKSRMNKTPLKDRDNEVKKNLDMWRGMLNREFKEGEAVALLKGNLESQNTVMRDPTMFRVMYKEHYRKGQKYCVWPSYDFAVCIVDSIEGVTHAIRSKEYELREELYYYILSLLKMRKPTLMHISRLSIKGTFVSKRKITPLVEQGKVWGWDDPRLPTIKGLRRRGILPEAIKKFVLRFGIGKQEKTVDWEFLLKENRALLDKKTKRMFFVPNPVLLDIGLNTLVELPFHPTEKSMGSRTLEVKGKVYISKDDLDKIGKKPFNLKGLGTFVYGDQGVRQTKEKGKTIQWVPYGFDVDAEVIVPLNIEEKGKFNEKSIKIIKGKVEKNIERIAEKEIVQFERFGFVILDEKKSMRFILSS